jgi:glutathione S-transferase
VPDPAAQAAMLERSAERIAHCWRLMDAQIDEPAPYLLGDTLGVLDLYVTVRIAHRHRDVAQPALVPDAADRAALGAAQKLFFVQANRVGQRAAP